VLHLSIGNAKFFRVGIVLFLCFWFLVSVLAPLHCCSFDLLSSPLLLVTACPGAHTSRRLQTQKCDWGVDALHARSTCSCHAEGQWQPTSGKRRQRICRAARVNHGDFQKGGNVGRGKGHLHVSMCPLTASRCNTHGSVIGLCVQQTEAQTP
jgi:hypothetical protein